MGTFDVTLTVPGTSIYYLPFGCSFKAVRCWAGGGKGATVTYPTQIRGGGGGGGAYAEPTDLTQYTDRMWNAKLTAVVGAGGNNINIDGQDSYVTLTLASTSGTEPLPIEIARAGGGTGVNDNINSGGAGGKVVTGSGYAGGSGASSVSTYGGGGGGGAGNGGIGGNAVGRTGGTGGAGGGGRGGYGSNINGVAGTAGTSRGGGGGGGYKTTTGIALGGSGAAGAIELALQWPDNVMMHIITDRASL